jgi:NADH:ubiquinone oxidoreductase subunit 5 (subunit L)/multisubunit Na+/H+ antiporter MnhA subunit
MLKTAIYGLLRVTFDLLNGQLWWWGVVALSLGLVTALFGVIFAAVQTDMKRLLAYSSIENIGIIVAGSSLGKLGGLIHRMPWVAWLALVGTLAIAGLPPLNGFVSEWLLLQAFLFTPSLPQSFVNMLVPVAAAALVLAVALAAYVMVKFYGIVFLGRPREANLAYAHDANMLERVALTWLAAGCVVLGLFPGSVIAVIDPVNAMLVGASAITAGSGNWLFLAPIDADRSSYSPLIVLAVIAGTLLLTIQIVHRYYHGRVRRAPPWDCGFPLQNPRMQDTAEGFGQPVRQVFEPFFRIERHLPSPFDAAPRYSVKAGDPLWHWLYLPVVRGADALARLVGRIQQGRISVYLTYSFVTLLALLFFVR